MKRKFVGPLFRLLFVEAEVVSYIEKANLGAILCFRVGHAMLMNGGEGILKILKGIDNYARRVSEKDRGQRG